MSWCSNVILILKSPLCSLNPAPLDRFKFTYPANNLRSTQPYRMAVASSDRHACTDARAHTHAHTHLTGDALMIIKFCHKLCQRQHRTAPNTQPQSNSPCTCTHNAHARARTHGCIWRMWTWSWQCRTLSATAIGLAGLGLAWLGLARLGLAWRGD